MTTDPIRILDKILIFVYGMNELERPGSPRTFMSSIPSCFSAVCDHWRFFDASLEMEAISKHLIELLPQFSTSLIRFTPLMPWSGLPQTWPPRNHCERQSETNWSEKWFACSPQRTFQIVHRWGFLRSRNKLTTEAPEWFQFMGRDILEGRKVELGMDT